MELNKEDNSNRRFILINNNEGNIIKTTWERLYRVINGKGSNNEKIKWEYSRKLKSLKNNSLRYLKIELIDKFNGDYEDINSKKELYKKEFNKDISIEDFRD